MSLGKNDVLIEQSDEGRGNKVRVTFHQAAVKSNLFMDIFHLMRESEYNPIMVMITPAKDETYVHIVAEYVNVKFANSVWYAVQDMVSTHELLASVLGSGKTSAQLLAEANRLEEKDKFFGGEHA